jgi:hypothetical protein
MRSVIYWSGSAPAPVYASILPVSEAPAPRVFLRDDYAPHFDPEVGIVRDGETVYLISLVEPHAYDGSMVAPIALGVRVSLSGEEDTIAEGSTTVHGPGPIAVGIPGLEPGAVYQFDLLAYYPDAPEDGSTSPETHQEAEG